jgi:hypothetical protein
LSRLQRRPFSLQVLPRCKYRGHAVSQ